MKHFGKRLAAGALSALLALSSLPLGVMAAPDARAEEDFPGEAWEQEASAVPEEAITEGGDETVTEGKDQTTVEEGENQSAVEEAEEHTENDTAGVRITLSASELALNLRDDNYRIISYTVYPRETKISDISVRSDTPANLVTSQIEQKYHYITLKPANAGCGELIIAAKTEDGGEITASLKLTVVDLDEDLALEALSDRTFIFADTAKTLEEELPLDALNGDPSVKWEWENPKTKLSKYVGARAASFQLNYTVSLQEGYPAYSSYVFLKRRFISLKKITAGIFVQGEEPGSFPLQDGGLVKPGTALSGSAGYDLAGDAEGYEAALEEDKGAAYAREALEAALSGASYTWSGTDETGNTREFTPQSEGSGKLEIILNTGTKTLSAKASYQVSGAVVGEFIFGEESGYQSEKEEDAFAKVSYYALLKDVIDPETASIRTEGVESLTVVSDDPYVMTASVGKTEDGVWPVTLSAVGEGQCFLTITAKSVEGGTITQSRHFTIMNPGVSLSAKSFTLNWKYKPGVPFGITTNPGCFVERISIPGENLSVIRDEEDSTSFRLVPYKNGSFLGKTGTFNLSVFITLSDIDGGSQFVRETITVKSVAKDPAVRVSQTKPVNMYYAAESYWSYGELEVVSSEDLSVYDPYEEDEDESADADSEGDKTDEDPFTSLEGADVGLEYNWSSSYSDYYFFDLVPLNNTASDGKGTLNLVFRDYVDAQGNALTLRKNFNVKIVTSTPKYSISPASITLYPDAGITYAKTRLLKENRFYASYFSFTSAPKGKASYKVAEANGEILVSGDSSSVGGTTDLTITPDGMNPDNKKAKPLKLSLKVNISKQTPALSLSPKTITLNGSETMWENARVRFTIQIAGAPGFVLDDSRITIASAKATDAKADAVLRNLELYMHPMEDGYRNMYALLSLRREAQEKGSFNYRVSYAINDSHKAEASLNVKIVNESPEKSIVLKAGRTKIDLLRRDGEDSYAGFTPVFKEPYAYGYIVAAEVTDDMADLFYVDEELLDDEDIIAIRAEELAPLKLTKYVVPLKLTLEAEDGRTSEVEHKVTVQVTQNKAKLTFSPSTTVLPAGKSSFSADLTAMIPKGETPAALESVSIIKGGESFSLSADLENDSNRSAALTFTKLSGAKPGKSVKLTLAVVPRGAAEGANPQTVNYTIKIK